MAATDPWKTFSAWCAGSFFAVTALAALLLILFDPYHNIPFSPPVERHYMDNNQRYMYPALAREPAYDSAVLGTSAVRMLPPDRLNEGFGARFAYLALDAGTPWEQAQIAKLFFRHHPAPRTLIYGVDRNWCASPAPYPRLTRRPFPPWMYDENPYNDLLYLFNGKSLEIATRQLRRYVGLDVSRYDADGFEDFLPPDEEYDLHRARMNIYKQEEPIDLADLAARAENAAPGWPGAFPDHELLRELLEATPEAAELIVVFPPHHAYFYLTHKRRLDACKDSVARLVREARPGATVLDFMQVSPLTARDENYWDDVHYNRASAALAADLVIAAAATGRSAGPAVMTVRQWRGEF